MNTIHGHTHRSITASWTRKQWMLPLRMWFRGKWSSVVYTHCLVLCALSFPVVLNAQYSAVNQHISLAGAGYITVPNSTDFNSLNNISIDAWVYPTQSGNAMTVLGNDIAQGYWFGLSTQGKVRFRPNSSIAYESIGTIPLNTWTHIAVAYDLPGSAIRFFINGGLDRVINVPQGWLGWSYEDLRIGADRLGKTAAYHWRGRLDEVRLWKGAVNFSTALGDLYAIPHAVAGGLYGWQLVAAWRLNGNAGDAIASHHGTTVGSVSWPASPDPPHYPRIGIWFRTPAQNPSRIDHFSIPHVSGLELHANYTIECWVKPSSSGGHPSFQTLLCKVGSVSAASYPVW
ncbi:MAG: LamG domain-containing protein, partial [Bacteroidetes bacterium]|nr:LamG domain-containing protein [Bacteroidota bacterium]